MKILLALLVKDQKCIWYQTFYFVRKDLFFMTVSFVNDTKKIQSPYVRKTLI